MKVTVHFVDGENLDGEAEQVSLDRGGFTLVGTAGNTRSAWVGAGAIKYIVLHAAFEETYGESDPRAGTDLTKVVLHFLDGEIQHSYRDTAYAEQAGGFVLRLFDRQTHQLHKALVPGSSLKGVFVVDEWDSRSEDEKMARSGPRRRLAARPARAPKPATPAAAEVAPPEAEIPPQPEPAPEPEPTPEPVPAPEATGDPAQEATDEPAPPAEDTPVEVAAPAAAGPLIVHQPEEPQLTEPVAASSLVLASHYDPEERRQGFVAGLAKRRRPNEALTPEQERHMALRLRISEVLGALGPEHPEDEEPKGD